MRQTLMRMKGNGKESCVRIFDFQKSMFFLNPL